jgi:hypothetical protein
MYQSSIYLKKILIRNHVSIKLRIYLKKIKNKIVLLDTKNSKYFKGLNLTITCLKRIFLNEIFHTKKLNLCFMLKNKTIYNLLKNKQIQSTYFVIYFKLIKT